MTIFESIKQFLSKENSEIQSPENFCPNCWGRQEYGGEFFDAIHQEKIDLNNIDQRKGWIDAYAVKNFEGIKLKNTGTTKHCPSCQITYQ